jgi:predicted phage baseplate assembly protein
MPLRPPALDDRSFDDLVEEVLARIPAHTPEWTNPRPGDPGRTLIELFAWLVDTLFYRANLIPERQRLAFLRLLGVQMRPAIPAQGLVSIAIDDETVTQILSIQPLATLKGPVNFETRSELTILPIAAEIYYKRPLTGVEETELGNVIQGLQQIYQLKDKPRPYVTTPVFADGIPDSNGFDSIQGTVDGCLWLALLAPSKESLETVRTNLGQSQTGGRQLLNIGVMPAISVPALFEEIGIIAKIPHVWEISTLDAQGQPDYLTLDVIADSTAGLTRQGVLRLALPAPNFIQAPSNDVRTNLEAGLGDRPPRLDSPEKAERLVAWVRLRPTVRLQSLSLSWVGINAVEIDQRKTLVGQVIGQSNGTTDQEMQLPGQSVEPESLQVQVEEPGRGYVVWQAIADLAIAGREARVFYLDREAGTIRFGDGMRGKIPEVEQRVRVAFMRSGGGRGGNLPPGSLTAIEAKLLNGNPVTTKLKVLQNLPLAGGEDAETLGEAEQRIPALFRHRDRAVTAEDYRTGGSAASL